MRAEPLRASPHTRGWTLGAAVHRRGRRGFPAHAGMDPPPARTSTRAGRLPRTRGDGPPVSQPCASVVPASPHTRGWTCRSMSRKRRSFGFPAHAGMDRLVMRGRWIAPGLPRTRGDGPDEDRYGSRIPAASPHTRGWTPAEACRGAEACGFPAHAGMDPTIRGRGRPRRRLPRTRGDGPHMSPLARSAAMASPHTRGWTRGAARRWPRARGFPAHAGMVVAAT